MTVIPVLLTGCSVDQPGEAVQRQTRGATAGDLTGPADRADPEAQSDPRATHVARDSMTRAEWERLWAEKIGACLSAAGWAVVVEPDGFTTTVPPEQRTAYAADSRRCQAEFARTHPLEPLTESDFRELYRQELETMVCLQEAGYPPVRQPVSEQEYVAAYLAGEPPPWSAYESFTGADSQEVERRCPQPSSSD